MKARVVAGGLGMSQTSPRWEVKEVKMGSFA